MKTDWLANVIKVAAILTAAPRWVGALLGAEGFALPADWLAWWVPVSAGLSAGMALVEGLAFAYVFEAWRNQQDKDGDNLLWFALISATIFVGVLAPYIAASVTHTTLDKILTNGFALAAWSVAVGASTIAIVASVGYAQKQRVAKRPKQDATTTQPDDPKSNRERIIEYHQAQPLAKSAIIAQQVGVSRQYVDRVLSSNGKAHHD